MDRSVASLFRLPDELLLLILGFVDAAGWKQARQTCRRLNTLAASLLFERIYFELCGRGCESLYNISQHPLLSSSVTTLVLRRVRGYRKFPDFDTWAQSTHQPGAPDVDLFTARETTYYDNKELSDQLMPYAKWVGMSREQKELLYQAYNADRKQQEKDVQDITNTLCFRAIDSGPPKFIHPHRAVSTGTANVAVRQLYKALRTLPNLRVLEHEPGFLHDEEWAFRWRDLYFHPYSIICCTDYEEDEDVEALQLSVVLQLLACVRRGDRKLQKTSMYVGGPAFATPERLQYLWNGNGHELTRICRSTHSSSSAADVDAYSNFTTPAESKLYLRQLDLMAHAFAGLTHLDCRMSDDDELVGCVETAAKLIFHFLCMTKNLQKLRLAIGRLVDGTLLPTYGRSEIERAGGSILLLWNLARRSPWSRIRNIELEIATNKNMLIKFLFAHKDTLRSLTLTRTSLVRSGDHGNTWELTLTEIGQGLHLESLTLAKLCDTLQDWSPSIQPRMLFDVEDKMWEEKSSKYEAYYTDRVNRIVRGEDIDSLDPTKAEAE